MQFSRDFALDLGVFVVPRCEIPTKANRLRYSVKRYLKMTKSDLKLEVFPQSHFNEDF